MIVLNFQSVLVVKRNIKRQGPNMDKRYDQLANFFIRQVLYVYITSPKQMAWQDCVGDSSLFNV